MVVFPEDKRELTDWHPLLSGCSLIRRTSTLCGGQPLLDLTIAENQNGSRCDNCNYRDYPIVQDLYFIRQLQGAGPRDARAASPVRRGGFREVNSVGFGQLASGNTAPI